MRTIHGLFASLLIATGILLCVYHIYSAVMTNYRYERDYNQFWTLADKSSTIAAKQKLLSDHLDALKVGYTNGAFADHNAAFLTTPNNSFWSNVEAEETLVQRLTEIQGMDPKSFQYNTAIEQITKQEQGEARAMTAVFDGCYTKASCPIVWSWFGILFCLFYLVIGVIGIIWAIFAYDMPRRELSRY